MLKTNSPDQADSLFILLGKAFLLFATIGFAIYLPASKVALLPALGWWAVWAVILAVVARFKTTYPTAVDISRSLFNFWGVGIAAASLIQWSCPWSAYLFLPLLILALIVTGKFTDYLGFSTPELEQSPSVATGRGLRMDVSPYDHPRFRFVNGCEIGMGAPENGDYVMPSGVVFHGGENYAFTPDQRYLLVPATVRTSQCALSIYDSERDVLYRLDCADANVAIAQAEAGQVDALLADAVEVSLKNVLDLRLPLDWNCAELSCSARSPDGQYELLGDLVLPDSLLAQTNPLAVLGLGMNLQSVTYRLSINGVDSGLLCHHRFGGAVEAENYRVRLVQWFMAGQALLIRATNAKNIEGWWRWRAEQGWDLLKLDQNLFPCQVNQSDVQVGIEPWNLLELNERVLRFKSSWQSSATRPTQRLHHFGRCPDRIEHPDVLHRHDERGRIVESPAAEAEIVIEYDLTSQTACIENQGLNGAVARISVIAGDWQQYAAYQYQIGTLILPGAWLLQHRVSSDGRYLALIRHADVPQLPSRIHLFDTQTQQLTEITADLIDPALGTFFDGQLLVYHLQGWRAQPFVAHRPLRYFDLPVPAPHQAWDFKRGADSEGYLYYRAEQIDATMGQLARVDYDLFQAPVATAEGDFTYHHSSMPLAVHYFGAVNEYKDNRMDVRHPYGHGCALIALQPNGVREWIGIRDVAPAMMFSADGRYLALCYWQEQMRITSEQIQANDRFDLWQLYLLDLAQKTLRIDTKKLGNLPDFQVFNHLVIELSISDNDWIHEDNETQTVQLKLDDLLKLPAISLQQVDDLWLQEQEPRVDWKINLARYVRPT